MQGIYKKLLLVQKQIGAIKKDSTNPYFKSKYFDINSLLEQVKPVLNAQGLVILQGLNHDGAYLCLDTQIIDTESGEKISFNSILPDGGDAQKQGSAITYFRRYAIQSLLALEAEDDDGNSAKTPDVPIHTLKPMQVKAKVTVDTPNIHDDNDLPF